MVSNGITSSILFGLEIIGSAITKLIEEVIMDISNIFILCVWYGAMYLRELGG